MATRGNQHLRTPCLLLMMLISAVASVPVDTGASRTRRDAKDADDYLKKYGYLTTSSDDGSDDLISEDERVDAIGEFQRMAGLEITGEMNDETLEMMNKPRCGVPDMEKTSSGNRFKRYVLYGSKWSRPSLTYRYRSYTPDMSKSAVGREIDRAFQQWSDVSKLEFYKRTSGTVDIDILFGADDHGDHLPFDGPGGTLAHAFYPDDRGRRGDLTGDVHFDEDEQWSAKRASGATSLYQVALHEIGHSLGIAHSDVRGAVMYPFYSGFDDDYRLHQDDIDAVQILYGEGEIDQPTTTTTTTRRPTTTTTTTTTRPTTTTTRRTTTRRTTTTTTTTTTPTTTTPRPRTTTTTTPSTDRGVPAICEGSTRIDAMTMLEDGSVYAFKGRDVYLLDEEGVVEGYPRRIRDVFEGLPDYIDAAVHWKRTWLYKSGWWRIAPARTYFFKGDQYWRYENYQLMSGYPRSIKIGFPGLPNNLDSAFVWSGNGRTYFTKGDQYYRYRRSQGSQSGKVDVNYPRDLSVWQDIFRTVDAVFRFKKGRRYQTYFFSGSHYLKFDDRTFQPDKDSPKDSGPFWFGCPTPDVKAKSEIANLESHDNIREVDPVDFDPNSAIGCRGSWLLTVLSSIVMLLLAVRAL